MAPKGAKSISEGSARDIGTTLVGQIADLNGPKGAKSKSEGLARDIGTTLVGQIADLNGPKGAKSVSEGLARDSGLPWIGVAPSPTPKGLYLIPHVLLIPFEPVLPQDLPKLVLER